MEIGTILVAALAMLIPISAITLNSAVGKAIAQRISERGSPRPAASEPDSSARIAQLEHDVRQLEEHNEFLRQLIEKSQ